MAQKFHLSKKQVLIGVSVVVVIAVAVGFGVLVRMLQQSGGSGINNPQDEAIALAKQKLPPLITEVQDLQNSGKQDEAGKKIDEALNNTSTDKDTRYMLFIQKGNLLVNNGDTQGGIAQYLEADKISETYEVTSLLGTSYQDVGDKAKAIEFYKKAYALVPQDGALAEADKENIRKRIEALGGKL